MTLSRRSLITGLASFVCAPAIVRCTSLMPVKAWAPPAFDVSIDDLLRAKEMLEKIDVPPEDRYLFDPESGIIFSASALSSS
jgi:hypothetical protein